MKKDIVITIFGSTGDLTARKLLPAITSLYKNKLISQNVVVIALGRKDYDTKSYLTSVQALTKEKLDLKTLEKIVTYYKMQITEASDYTRLNEYIKSKSNENAKHLYYLAIGPDILPVVAKNISEQKLIDKNDNNQILVFEKPFGNDLASAKQLNQMLHTYYSESQIYRIDHYLAKEMIQNILPIRFTNPLFSNTWNNEFIEKVNIVVAEEEGILNRALYYDISGALKDMVQSHILQLIALVAMDKPKKTKSDAIKLEKLKVLKNLEVIKDSVIFGQYNGYLNELNVPKDSKTETLVKFDLLVNTPNFKNVVFSILTGKALNKKETYIEIIYKNNDYQTFENKDLSTNILKLSTAPKDELTLLINNKTIGLTKEIIGSNLSYNMQTSKKIKTPEAYEKMILDVINQDQTLFVSADEIEVCWQFTDLVSALKKDLVIY